MFLIDLLIAWKCVIKERPRITIFFFYFSTVDDCRWCQHTSSPLGNGAIVETSDRKILVLQRSTNVGEFPGSFVFPGGHPEVTY